MKSIITAAAVLFTANVSAVDFYNGLGKGNPDLFMQHVSADEVIGAQPSIGDSISRYHGLDDGNADLFKGDGSQPVDSTGRPDIYKGVSGNPDLHF